jgi:hypothetical protein
MIVRYHVRQAKIVPEYVCQRDGADHIVLVCQHVLGEQLDQAIGQLLIDAVTPLALEVTLTVQQEMQTRLDEVDRLRKSKLSAPAMRPISLSDAIFTSTQRTGW